MQQTTLIPLDNIDSSSSQVMLEMLRLRAKGLGLHQRAEVCVRVLGEMRHVGPLEVRIGSHLPRVGRPRRERIELAGLVCAACSRGAGPRFPAALLRNEWLRVCRGGGQLELQLSSASASKAA